MAWQTALSFLAAGGDSGPAPVALVHGAEAFLREFVAERIRQSLAARGYQCLFFHTAEVAGLSGLIRELNEPPLFAGRRLLVARVGRARAEREARPARERGGPGAGGRAAARQEGLDEMLAGVAARVAEPTRLLLLLERETAPARLRAAVEEAGGLVVECMRPFEEQAAALAGALAQAQGLALAPRAALELAEACAGSPAAIGAALGRLKARLEPRSSVTPADLRQEFLADVAPAPFALADSIARGRAGAGLRQLGRALSAGRDPNEVLAVEIVPVLRRILVAAAVLERNGSRSEVAQALGVPAQSRLAGSALEGARNYGFAALAKAHRKVCELDRGFKSGQVKEQAQALWELLYSLFRDRRSSRGAAGVARRADADS